MWSLLRELSIDFFGLNIIGLYISCFLVTLGPFLYDRLHFLCSVMILIYMWPSLSRVFFVLHLVLFYHIDVYTTDGTIEYSTYLLSALDYHQQEYITRGGVYNRAVLLYPANAKVAWAIWTWAGYCCYSYIYCQLIKYDWITKNVWGVRCSVKQGYRRPCLTAKSKMADCTWWAMILVRVWLNLLRMAWLGVTQSKSQLYYQSYTYQYHRSSSTIDRLTFGSEAESSISRAVHSSFHFCDSAIFN